MENKKYNFGEKEVEFINGIECPVWQTPKYLEAKKKVIETLESDKYKNILSESDFWILVNTYANKTKAMYSGLIISHNGCLKINDTLENKVNPKCFTIDKEGYGNSLVFTYVDDEVYENGEVNLKNCKNDYPYAMAYKRCFDRVVLKKCKLAYAGIYSDSEAEEFKEKPEETSEIETKKEDYVKATPEQVKRLKQVYKGKSLTKLLEVNGISDISDMPIEKASELLETINKIQQDKEFAENNKFYDMQD